MPTITKIAQQKKKKDRYSIFLDGDYAFSVEEDVLVRHALTKGKELSKKDIDEITEKDDYQRAYLMAIQFLSYRMRSADEMHAYLQKKEVNPDWIEQIMTSLTEDKYLEDQRFAEMFVRDRIHQTSKGPQVINRELSAKGVNKENREKALAQFEEDLQKEHAFHWLQKERQKTSKDSLKQREDKLRVKMLQKGYSNAIVTAVFQENPPAVDAEKEQDIFIKQADKLHQKHQKKLSGFDLKMKVKAALYQKGFSSEMIDEYIDNIES